MGRSSRSTWSISVVAVFAALGCAGFAVAANPDFQLGFPVDLSGERIVLGPTAVGDVDGDEVDDIVIGGLDGKVHVYTGTGIEIWTHDTGDMAIESKPVIADVDGDTYPEVIVTAGSTRTPESHGGLYILDHLGNQQCEFQTIDKNNDGWREGVFSTPAVADLDGDDGGLLEIAFGAWDRYVRVIHHDCTPLWENWVVDTVWSSPAIGDVDMDGVLDVVIGVDSDDEPAPKGELEGGQLHVFNGLDGSGLAGFPVQVDEVIWSSPALGDIDNDGWIDIVVGTGYCWDNPACAPDGENPGVGKYLNAWDHNGNALSGWPVLFPGTYAFASPALADVDEDGVLEVIVNTRDPDDNQGGMLYVLNGDGSNVPGWPTQPTVPAGTSNITHRSTDASPVVADLNGDGSLEIVLPCNFDLAVFDANGNQLSRDQFPPASPEDYTVESRYAIAATAAVGDIDGDNDLELVVGSAALGGDPGRFYAWDFPGVATPEAMPWPSFRRSSDNRAHVQGALIFSDGFESGTADRWLLAGD